MLKRICCWLGKSSRNGLINQTWCNVYTYRLVPRRINYYPDVVLDVIFSDTAGQVLAPMNSPQDYQRPHQIEVQVGPCHPNAIANVLHDDFQLSSVAGEPEIITMAMTASTGGPQAISLATTVSTGRPQEISLATTVSTGGPQEISSATTASTGGP